MAAAIAIFNYAWICNRRNLCGIQIMETLKVINLNSKMLAKSDRDHAYKTPKDKNYKVSSS